MSRLLSSTQDLHLSSYWPNPVCFPVIDMLDRSKEYKNYLKCILWYHYDKRKSLILLNSLQAEYVNKAQTYMFAEDSESTELASLKVQISAAMDGYDSSLMLEIFNKCKGSWNFRSIQYTILSGCYLLILYFYNNRHLMQGIKDQILPYLKLKSTWVCMRGLVNYSFYLFNNNLELIEEIPNSYNDFKQVIIAYNVNEYPIIDNNLLANYVKSLQINNVTEKKKLLLPCLKGSELLKVITLIELFRIYKYDSIGEKIKVQVLGLCGKYKFMELLHFFKNERRFNKHRLF